MSGADGKRAWVEMLPCQLGATGYQRQQARRLVAERFVRSIRRCRRDGALHVTGLVHSKRHASEYHQVRLTVVVGDDDVTLRERECTCATGCELERMRRPGATHCGGQRTDLRSPTCYSVRHASAGGKLARLSAQAVGEPKRAHQELLALGQVAFVRDIYQCAIPSNIRVV